MSHSFSLPQTNYTRRLMSQEPQFFFFYFFFYVKCSWTFFFWFSVCEDLLQVIRSMMSNGLGVLSKPTADVSPEATETVGCSLSMICRQKWFTAVQCQVARMKLQQVCWMEVWANFQFCKIPRLGNEVNSPILVYVTCIIRHIELILWVWDLKLAFEVAHGSCCHFIYI